MAKKIFKCHFSKKFFEKNKKQLCEFWTGNLGKQETTVHKCKIATIHIFTTFLIKETACTPMENLFVTWWDLMLGICFLIVFRVFWVLTVLRIRNAYNFKFTTLKWPRFWPYKITFARSIKLIQVFHLLDNSSDSGFKVDF